MLPVVLRAGDLGLPGRPGAVPGRAHQRQPRRGVVQAGQPDDVAGQRLGDGHGAVAGVQLERAGVHARRGPVVLQPDPERGVDRLDRPGGPDVVALRVGVHAGEALMAQPRLHRAGPGRAGPEPGRIGVRAEVVMEQLAAGRAHRRRIPLRGGQVAWPHPDLDGQPRRAGHRADGPAGAGIRRGAAPQPHVARPRRGPGCGAHADDRHRRDCHRRGAEADEPPSSGHWILPCPRSSPESWASRIRDTPANQDSGVYIASRFRNGTWPPVPAGGSATIGA